MTTTARSSRQIISHDAITVGRNPVAQGTLSR